jgi:hypothetical protein
VEGLIFDGVTGQFLLFLELVFDIFVDVEAFVLVTGLLSVVG